MRIRLAVTVCAAALLLESGIARAAVIDAVIIDTFETAQALEVEDVSPPVVSAAHQIAAGEVVGGFRDLFVSKTAGDTGERVRARVNPSGLDLLRMTIDDASGSVSTTYDGHDADSNPVTGVNFTGLGGIDFTAGLLDAFLEMEVNFSDVGGPVRFTVFQNVAAGDKFATGTINVPGGIPSGSSVILTKELSTFVLGGTAASLGEVFTNVGALIMTIDATALAQQGWDMRMNYVKTRGTIDLPAALIPEPASLTLLGLGLLSCLGFRRVVMSGSV